MISTDASIKKMKPPEKRFIDVRVQRVAGLYLRVFASGRKVFYLRSRPPGEKNPIPIKIGPYGTGTEAFTLKEACRKAEDWKEAIKAGDDPREEGRLRKQRADDSFSSVVDRFLKSHGRKIKPNTKKQYDSILNGKDVHLLKKKPVHKITRQQVVSLIDDIADSGRLTQANRTLAVLKKFFGWCAEKHILKPDEIIPTDRIKPVTKEKARARVLTPGEMCLIWRASERLGWPFGDHIRLLMATAQRQSEAAGLTRKAVSGGIWDQSDNKAGREHLLPLNDLALSILEAVTNTTTTKYFYFSTNGENPISGFSKAKRNLDNEIKKICENEGLELFSEPWRTHDIRRSVTTHMRRLGIAQDVCSRILNHASKGVTGQVYDKYDMLAEKKHAMETWGNYLDSLINDKPDNVVELKQNLPEGR